MAFRIVDGGRIHWAGSIESPLADARLVLLESTASMVESDQGIMGGLRRSARAYLAFVVDVRVVIELAEVVPRLPRGRSGPRKRNSPEQEAL